MFITTKGRNALKIMIDLARHEGEGYIPLGDIAERQKESRNFRFTAVGGGACGKRARKERGLQARAQGGRVHRCRNSCFGRGLARARTVHRQRLRKRWHVHDVAPF